MDDSFESELVALINRWLVRGCDSQIIVNAMTLHKGVISELYKDPAQTELDIG